VSRRDPSIVNGDATTTTTANGKATEELIDLNLGVILVLINILVKTT
jgi:hypothetical protein